MTNEQKQALEQRWNIVLGSGTFAIPPGIPAMTPYIRYKALN